jgi:ABC-type bacteriocin/lantibiotic exporter with double-glycine peptidase domain
MIIISFIKIANLVCPPFAQVMTDTKKGNNKRTLLPAIAIASALAIIGGAFASVAAHDSFPNYADLNKAAKY